MHTSFMFEYVVRSLPNFVFSCGTREKKGARFTK